MVQNELKSNGSKPGYIIIGDTGEKDEEAGERIISKYGHSIKGVFLHAVSGSADRSIVTIPKDRIYLGVPIFYFRTYVGAASKACKNGLISSEGLFRVINEAEKDITLKEKMKTRPINFVKNYPFNRMLKDSRRKELELDIDNAYKLNKSLYALSMSNSKKPTAYY